jgi:hypothetical protein
MKSFDRMARPVSLTLHGHRDHKTNVGGVLTVFAFVTVGAWYIW